MTPRNFAAFRREQLRRIEAIKEDIKREREIARDEPIPPLRAATPEDIEVGAVVYHVYPQQTLWHVVDRVILANHPYHCFVSDDMMLGLEDAFVEVVPERKIPETLPDWKPSVLSRRQKNIIRKMANGYLYGSQGSPRMTEAEANALTALGFVIQIESAHGADRSAGQLYYPLIKKQFRARARAAGIEGIPKEEDL
jgi:hypothetical protein